MNTIETISGMVKKAFGDRLLALPLVKFLRLPSTPTGITCVIDVVLQAKEGDEKAYRHYGRWAQRRRVRLHILREQWRGYRAGKREFVLSLAEDAIETMKELDQKQAA